MRRLVYFHLNRWGCLPGTQSRVVLHTPVLARLRLCRCAGCVLAKYDDFDIAEILHDPGEAG